MELYEVALQLLLERRDRERHVPLGPALSRTDQTLLLRDLAYWLIRNGWTSAPVPRVRERIADKLARMAHLQAGPDEVYRLLRERSGLLREPVEGQTDFVHRTFQEYLAAAEAVATDDIGVLVANAWTDVWSEVVVMAAGHATAAQRVELVQGLLDRAASERRPQLCGALRLVAVACLETSPELPPDLRRQVQQAAETLLPPRTISAAQQLAKIGGFSLDLLARTEPLGAAEVAATIRAVAEIGDPAALPLLVRFGTDTRKSVFRELLRAWPRFDPDEYARTVLANHPLTSGDLDIDDRRLIPALRHLTNLRNLHIRTRSPKPVDPSFIHDLPDLERLLVPDLTGLEPLAGHRLQFVSQTCSFLGPPERMSLSLSPLADATNLTAVIVRGRPVEDLAALRQVRSLDWLELYVLGSADALAELAVLPNLRHLSVGGIPELRDLSGLSFLAQPSWVGVWDCPSLTDASALGRWSGSLRNIRLELCPAVDLTTLKDLRGLQNLDLWGSGALDLSPVVGHQELRSVMLGRGALPDLRPLNNLPSLLELAVLGIPEVDVGPLAGKERLTVRVDRSTTVHGADRLGPGSRVVRR